MKALHSGGFPVPTPLENNRHAVLMSLIDATPLYQVAGRMTMRHDQFVTLPLANPSLDPQIG